MSNNNLNGKDFLLGAIVGSVLGAVTALLVTPKTGKELRGDIKHQYDNASEKTKAIATDVSQKTQALAQDVSERSQNIARDVSSKSQMIAGKAKELGNKVSTEFKDWNETRKQASAQTKEGIEEAAGAIEDTATTLEEGSSDSPELKN